MTATFTEIELLESLDFDPENQCEAKDGCDAKATWVLTYPCCGAVSLLCTPCRDHSIEWLKSRPVGCILRCLKCAASPIDPDGFTWKPL